MQITISELQAAKPELGDQPALGMLILLNSLSNGRFAGGLDADTQLSAGEAVACWLAAEIQSWGSIEEARLMLIFQLLGASLIDVGEAICHDFTVGSDEPQRYYIAFGDRRYVTLSGSDKMLDLQEGKVMPYHTHKFTEGLSYDVTEVGLAGLSAVQQAREGNDGPQPDS